MLPLLMIIGLLGNQEKVENPDVILKKISSSINENCKETKHYTASVSVNSKIYTNKKLEDGNEKPFNKLFKKTDEHSNIPMVNDVLCSNDNFFIKTSTEKGETLVITTGNKETVKSFLTKDYTKRANGICLVKRNEFPTKISSSDFRIWGVDEYWLDYAFVLADYGAIKSVKKSKGTKNNDLFEVNIEKEEGSFTYIFDSSINYLPVVIIAKLNAKKRVSLIEIEYQKIKQDVWFPKSRFQITKSGDFLTINDIKNEAAGSNQERTMIVKKIELQKEEDIQKDAFSLKLPVGTEIRDSNAKTTTIQK